MTAGTSVWKDCTHALVRPKMDGFSIEGTDIKENGIAAVEETKNEEEIDEQTGEHEYKEKEDGLSQQVAMGSRTRQEEHEDVGEEGRPSKGVAPPQRVSKQEKEEHSRTHAPFRSWCRYCVRGRATNTPHMKLNKLDPEFAVPRISMDYFFMSKQDEAAQVNPLLVMVDEGTGEKYARAVGRKGLGDRNEMDWLIKDMSAEMKSWGHAGGLSGSIILKSDGENAIKAVKDALGRFHGGRVVPEQPAKGESPSNGIVEEAGKTVRGFTRVLKEQIEGESGVILNCDDNIVLWMVRWAAMLCSRYLVGKDGRTAFERRRGRRCNIPTVAYGEKVWFKQIKDSKDTDNKFESDWQEGIWLGHQRSSNETLVGTRDGVVRAYAIRRQEEEQRWDGKFIKEMKGTPQQPNPLRPGPNIPVRINFDPPSGVAPVPVEAPSAVPMRRMLITEDLLVKYGYTESCAGCRHKRAGLGERRSHTEACRERIGAAMDADEDGRRRKKQNEEREARRMTEKYELENKEGAVQNATGENVEDTIDNEHEVNLEGNQGKEFDSGNDDNMTVNDSKPKRKIDTELDDNEPIRKKNKGDTLTEDFMAEEETDMVKALTTTIQDIAEVYIPEVSNKLFAPVFSKQEEKLGLKAGELMDITFGWNFRLPEHRRQAMEYIEENKPKLVIGRSPEVYSISPGSKAWFEMKEYIKFAIQLYRIQLTGGRWFLHEHPVTASSNSLLEVQKFMREEGVESPVANLCRCGSETWTTGHIKPTKRPTGFLTNTSCISRQLSLP